MLEVKKRFGIEISSNNLTFVKVPNCDSIKPDNYPSFTLFWQALASIRVCFSALTIAPCDIFIDSMGVGFAYPVVKMFFYIKVVTYTHYPFIR